MDHIVKCSYLDRTLSMLMPFSPHSRWRSRSPSSPRNLPLLFFGEEEADELGDEDLDLHIARRMLSHAPRTDWAGRMQLLSLLLLFLLAIQKNMVECDQKRTSELGHTVHTWR